MSAAKKSGDAFFNGFLVLIIFGLGIGLFFWTKHNEKLDKEYWAEKSKTKQPAPAGINTQPSTQTPKIFVKKDGNDTVITDNFGDWIYMLTNKDGTAESVVFGLDSKPPSKEDKTITETNLKFRIMNGIPVNTPKKSGGLVRLAGPRGIGPVDTATKADELTKKVNALTNNKTPIEKLLFEIAGVSSAEELYKKK